MSDKKKSDTEGTFKELYKYTGGKSVSKKIPVLNSVYDDGMIYRKENYGVFVKFDNNNFNGLLHKSKLGSSRYLSSLNIGDKISVSIIEIKSDMKISLKLFQQEFPELNNSKKKNPTLNSRWSTDLNKIKRPSKEIIKRQDNNRKIRCKYSGNLIYEKDSYKCKESSDGEIYYFESLYNALRYNKLKNRYMKLLLDDGSLEILQLGNYHDKSMDEIDIL